MMHSSRPPPSGSSSNATELRRIFNERVHQLIQLGYKQLTPTNCVKEEEPAITGFLVKAIDNLLSNRSKTWMSFFSVHDDPPVNNGCRKGKRRKRVDLRIDCGNISPRARYLFEAKRLSKVHTETTYLGADGLGCFLRGDYAGDEDEAGMLAYVQSGELEEWSQKIGDRFTNEPNNYSVDPGVAFGPHSMRSTRSLKGYQSRHNRSSVGRSILIVHILLKCY